MLFDAPLPRPPHEVRAGVAHLPGFLTLGEQEAVVTHARSLAREAAGTPAAMRRVPVGDGMTSAYLMTLGQAYLSQPFRYVPRGAGGVEAPDVPAGWQELARRALLAAARISPALAPWAAAYRADVALVNYYPPGASMGLHVDAMEDSPAPVISLSIGDEALFRMGNTEGRTRPWDDVLLMSGDLLVFGGPARRAYHGVPRIHPGTAPAGCGVAEGRINVTLRQA
ncbi:alpha-ketoglutarate-dependent dioxygenase AlkB [Corynebacterium comes]|uniref:Alpha-ketoglutarate-dependent dioxygenase AlkB n=1 Tax=Corynebacterium comes TaxID=2675218 RepID=A0A6B8W910_9CORY|nr:Alpha-ketoglutarate-dependent dioxygenase AlkB [Corynebacterium comes]